MCHQPDCTQFLRNQSDLRRRRLCLSVKITDTLGFPIFLFFILESHPSWQPASQLNNNFEGNFVVNFFSASQCSSGFLFSIFFFLKKEKRSMRRIFFLSLFFFSLSFSLCFSSAESRERSSFCFFRSLARKWKRSSGLKARPNISQFENLVHELYIVQKHQSTDFWVYSLEMFGRIMRARPARNTRTEREMTGILSSAQFASLPLKKIIVKRQQYTVVWQA